MPALPAGLLPSLIWSQQTNWRLQDVWLTSVFGQDDVLKTSLGVYRKTPVGRLEKMSSWPKTDVNQTSCRCQFVCWVKARSPQTPSTHLPSWWCILLVLIWNSRNKAHLSQNYICYETRLGYSRHAPSGCLEYTIIYWSSFLTTLGSTQQCCTRAYKPIITNTLTPPPHTLSPPHMYTQRQNSSTACVLTGHLKLLR